MRNLKTYTCALIPIIYMYSFISWFSIGEVLTLMVLVGSLVIDEEFSFNYSTIKTFWLFVFLALYNLWVTAMVGITVSQSIKNSLAMLLFGLEFALIRNGQQKLDELYKATSIIGIFLVAFLLVQFVAFYVLGILIRGNFLGLRLVDSLFFVSEHRGRLSSLLGEPAHLTIYLAPILVTALCKKDYKMVVLCCGGMLLSTSSTGLVLAVAIPAVYMFFTLKIDASKKIAMILVSLVLLIIGYGIIIKYFDHYTSKFTMDSLSSNIRIFGQLKNFSKLDFFQLFFGVGLNNWKIFMQRFSIDTVNYANSFLFAVMSFGFFGFCILFVAFVRLSKFLLCNENRRFIGLYLFVLILVFITDQVMFNRNLLYLLIWLSYAAEYFYALEGDNLLAFENDD